MYLQSCNADTNKAVYDHRLLLKTLSRSSDVHLDDVMPADRCVGVTVGDGTTLHLDVAVSGIILVSSKCI